MDSCGVLYFKDVMLQEFKVVLGPEYKGGKSAKVFTAKIVV